MTRVACKVAEAEHYVKMAQLEAQRQAEQAAPEQAKRDAKVAEATRLFDEDQARKRERMAMEAEREQARGRGFRRLGQDGETLSRIAENSDDPQVAGPPCASWRNCARPTWTPRRTPTETTKVRGRFISPLTWRDMELLQAYIDMEQRKRDHC